jgi:homoserine kinase
MRTTAYAPGSVSNVGPGFDCFGIAVAGRGDRVSVQPGSGRGLRVIGVSDPRLPGDPQRNTATLAAAAVLRRAGLDPSTIEPGLEFIIDKGLPLAGGMGGSAASAVAGAVAVDSAMRTHLSREALLEAALEAEATVSGRHPDNVAPSLWGGAVIVASLEPLRLVRTRVHPSLKIVLVSPAYAIETARARAVLPATVSREDAVAQAGNLAHLVLGLERGDGDLIRGAMHDRIAEPARMALFPGYLEARLAALEAGAYGVAISGAGPTVVAFTGEANPAVVAGAVIDAYRRRGIDASPHFGGVDAEGARILGGPGSVSRA